MSNDNLLSDRSLDPMVVLLMATDLTIDDLLSIRRGQVYSGSVLVIDRPPYKRRSVLVPIEARWALRGRTNAGYDPDVHLFTDEFGGLPTRDQVLRSVADHLDVLHDRRQTKTTRRAIQRLGRAFRQAYDAA